MWRMCDLPDDVLMRMAELCMKLGIDGHRGELTVSRAACAFAAYHHKREVQMDAVKAVLGRITPSSTA